MITAIAFTLIVSTAERDATCERGIACAFPESKTVYMREYPTLPAGRYTIEIPEGLRFPSLSPKTHSDHYRLIRCGQKIADHNGLPTRWNALATLCHEAAHIAGKNHH